MQVTDFNLESEQILGRACQLGWELVSVGSTYEEQSQPEPKRPGNDLEAAAFLFVALVL